MALFSRQRATKKEVEETKYGKGKREVIQVRWQSEKRREDGSRYLVVQSYTSSTHEKANIWKAIESWLGKKFSQLDREAFDFESLINRNCLLQVIHIQSGTDETYARVQGIVPLPEGTPDIFVEDYVRVVDREDEAA